MKQVRLSAEHKTRLSAFLNGEKDKLISLRALSGQSCVLRATNTHECICNDYQLLNQLRERLRKAQDTVELSDDHIELLISIGQNNNLEDFKEFWNEITVLCQ